MIENVSTQLTVFHCLCPLPASRKGLRLPLRSALFGEGGRDWRPCISYYIFCLIVLIQRMAATIKGGNGYSLSREMLATSCFIREVSTCTYTPKTGKPAPRLLVSGADPGFLEKGLISIKVWGGRFADFISFFLISP